MSQRFEFVIVGGGVYGCGLAWELAGRGASVALLEARAIGSGASGGPGKRGVRANGRDERELPLARLANEIWPVLASDLGASIGYERTGGLELFESESTRERALAQVDLQNRSGIRTQLVTREGLRVLQPGLSDRIIGAVFCPDDGVVDHSATTLALASAATRRGGMTFEHTPVSALDRSGSAVRAAVTASQRFEVTRDVILLANSGVTDLLASIGVKLPIARVFPQVLITEPAPSLGVPRLVGHLERRAIVKQLPDGSLRSPAAGLDAGTNRRIAARPWPIMSKATTQRRAKSFQLCETCRFTKRSPIVPKAWGPSYCRLSTGCPAFRTLSSGLAGPVTASPSLPPSTVC